MTMVKMHTRNRTEQLRAFSDFSLPLAIAARYMVIATRAHWRGVLHIRVSVDG